MPTYDFRCPRGHLFEVFQKMSDTGVRPCPECGEDAERQISGGSGLWLGGRPGGGEPPHAPPDPSAKR